MVVGTAKAVCEVVVVVVVVPFVFIVVLVACLVPQAINRAEAINTAGIIFFILNSLMKKCYNSFQQQIHCHGTVTLRAFYKKQNFYFRKKADL